MCALRHKDCCKDSPTPLKKTKSAEGKISLCINCYEKIWRHRTFRDHIKTIKNDNEVLAGPLNEIVSKPSSWLLSLSRGQMNLLSERMCETFVNQPSMLRQLARGTEEESVEPSDDEDGHDDESVANVESMAVVEEERHDDEDEDEAGVEESMSDSRPWDVPLPAPLVTETVNGEVFVVRQRVIR